MNYRKSWRRNSQMNSWKNSWKELHKELSVELLKEYQEKLLKDFPWIARNELSKKPPNEFPVKLLKFFPEKLWKSFLTWTFGVIFGWASQVIHDKRMKRLSVELEDIFPKEVLKNLIEIVEKNPKTIFKKKIRFNSQSNCRGSCRTNFDSKWPMDCPTGFAMKMLNPLSNELSKQTSLSEIFQ